MIKEELDCLITSKKFNDARVLILESGLNDAKKYKLLAHLQVNYLHSLAEASKAFTISFYLNRKIFTYEDLITYAKCCYASSIGEGEIKILRDFFYKKLLEDIGLERGLKKIYELRFLVAINDLNSALDIYNKNYENIKVNKVFGKEICYMLLWTFSYSLLDNFLGKYKEVLDGDIYKEYKQALSTYPFRNIEVLIDTFGYKVIWFKGKDINKKKLVITFGYVGTNKFSIPYAASMLIGSDYDVLHIAQSDSTYYQFLSIAAFKNIISTVKNTYNYTEFFTYGSSLGGYCSIYYGCSIDNCTIISGSPRNPISPIYNARKYPIFEYNHLDFNFLEFPDNKIFILNDSENLIDRKTIDKIIKPNLSNLEFFDFPFSGHPTTSFLAKIKLLKRMILNIIEYKCFGLSSDSIDRSNIILLNNRSKYKMSQKVS